MAPTAFGRLSAATGRMTQGLMHGVAARIQIYTDGPCAALRGTRKQVRHYITLMAMFWMPLWGQHVDWIGYHFDITPAAITATINKSFMNEYAADVANLIKQRRITTRVLRSFAGRTGHIANLLYAWRPFISELWAALYDRQRAGSSRVWVRPIDPAPS